MQLQTGQVQYVMINNQMVPVQVMNQEQLKTIPGLVAAPQGHLQQPTSASGIPYGEDSNALVAVRAVPQSTSSLVPAAGALDLYTNNVLCYTLTYLFFFIGCIGVQYGLYGSLTAARLWISSYVFLIIALVLFFVVTKVEQNLWLRILLIQLFFLILSFILEIAAFATAVSHPVLYNYEGFLDSQYAMYNDRRILYAYTSGNQTKQSTISSCQSLYEYSTTNYISQAAFMCNPLLGYSVSSSQYSLSQCIYLFEYFTLSTYETYYSSYCDSYLNGDPSSGLSLNDGNLCTGIYDPLKDYCYPLQYAMLAYAIINFIVYLMLFGGLSRRIYNFYKQVRVQGPQIQPDHQQPVESLPI